MARRLGPQDPELETLLESVGAPEGEPSVHSKLDTVDSEIGVIDGVVDAILVDTGTTIPGTITALQGDVTAILEDTSTTIPGTISTLDGKVVAVGADVDQALLDIAAVKAVADDILVDTGTTLPATLTAIEGKIDTVDTVVDGIAADIGDFTGGGTTLLAEVNSIKTIVDGISTASGNFTVLVEEQLERPDTGTRDYLYTIMHRVNGVMTDLDANPTADLDYSDGTEANTLLYDDAATPVQSTTSTKKSTGYYQGRIRVAAATAVGPMVFVVTGAYNTNTLKQARGTRIDESFTLAWNSTDAARLENASDNTDTLLTNVAAVQADVDLVQTDLIAALADLVTIKGYTDGVEPALTSIEGKVDVIDGNVDDLEVEVAKIESKDTNLTFDRATDSLEAIREKLDVMSAASGVVFRAVKASGSVTSGNNETVTLTSVEGFLSAHAKLYNVKVTASAATTNFEVEIYEDSGLTKLLASWNKLAQSKPLNDNLAGFVFWNQDGSPSATMYVKVSNVAGAASVFTVEVRGDVVG